MEPITLETPLDKCFKITPAQKDALDRLKITTPRDLLYHFPSRYQNISEVSLIRDVPEGAHTVVYAKVTSIRTGKAYRKKIPLAEATISDETGTAKVVWFHQPYIANMIQKGALVKLAGKATKRGNTTTFTNPEIERVSSVPIDISSPLFGKTEEGYYPIYPETKGLTSRWFFHHIKKVLASGALDTLVDPIPDTILKTYSLPSLRTALVWIHTPKKDEHSASARKRFAFEEIFFIQLERLRQRTQYEQNPTFVIDVSQKHIDDFLKRFPFTPTDAQMHAIEEIVKDISTPKPMTRLLEGDVGSGKTLVAAATCYAAISSHPKENKHARLQVAYMAPTEILARQHFESFIEYFSHLPIQIGLITGSECRKFPSKVDPTSHTHISRAQLLKWVANGEVPIVIGTHSLIQKSVEFKNLAYTIIDEQHRFGVMQRKKLVRRTDNTPEEKVPHLLSMTATPIPRTLALTIYGDLDLTLLDQMPAGRKPIITEIVMPKKRDETYAHVKKELAAGRQVYVICPRIDEPDPQKAQTLLTKSVKQEAERLKKEVFTDATIDILHSKMKPADKDAVMQKFARGEIDILVATSVVEVGVNVPNATVILIEGAERFGLSQLHQLRGRVLRGTHQAYCYLLSDSDNKNSLKRLEAFKQAKNGFELAELDLELRGSGELSGTKQWGVSDIGMEAIKNIKMVEAARKEAQALLASDSELANYPLLLKHLNAKTTDVHFE